LWGVVEGCESSDAQQHVRHHFRFILQMPD
jgi:hypothetical protein